MQQEACVELEPKESRKVFLRSPRRALSVKKLQLLVGDPSNFFQNYTFLCAVPFL